MRGLEDVGLRIVTQDVGWFTRSGNALTGTVTLTAGVGGAAF